MTPRLKPKIRDLENCLLADAVKLRGVKLRRLGYYGGPARNGDVAFAHALDSEELEPFYDTEEERAAAERQALLLAGCLWKCSSMLIHGLYNDIYELRTIEDENVLEAQGQLRLDFINDESEVLFRLPPAYAANYTAEFAQKFLVVLAGMTTKLAGKWTPPTCLAEELAVHCLAVLIAAYGEAEGIGLERHVESTLYEALLEDTDHLFMYPVPGFSEEAGTDPTEMVAMMSATGFAELDFNIWFEPFNDDRKRAVSPFVHYAGAPARGSGDNFPGIEPEADVRPDVTEAFAPADRAGAIAAGDLVDVTEAAGAMGFNCDVAFTKAAFAAVVGTSQGGPGPAAEDERITDALFKAVQAASSVPERRSTTIVIVGEEVGQPVRGTLELDVVAGSPEPGAAVVTIQRS